MTGAGAPRDPHLMRDDARTDAVDVRGCDAPRTPSALSHFRSWGGGPRFQRRPVTTLTAQARQPGSAAGPARPGPQGPLAETNCPGVPGREIDGKPARVLISRPRKRGDGLVPRGSAAKRGKNRRRRVGRRREASSPSEGGGESRSHEAGCAPRVCAPRLRPGRGRCAPRLDRVTHALPAPAPTPHLADD